MNVFGRLLSVYLIYRKNENNDDEEQKIDEDKNETNEMFTHTHWAKKPQAKNDTSEKVLCFRSFKLHSFSTAAHAYWWFSHRIVSLMASSVCLYLLACCRCCYCTDCCWIYSIFHIPIFFVLFSFLTRGYFSVEKISLFWNTILNTCSVLMASFYHKLKFWLILTKFG